MRVCGAAGRVTKLKGLSVEVLPTLAGRSFDVVYIDGSHDKADCLEDAILAWRLLKEREDAAAPAPVPPRRRTRGEPGAPPGGPPVLRPEERGVQPVPRLGLRRSRRLSFPASR
jgi:hypothetical protein